MYQKGDETMATTKAQQKAVNKYIKNNYDRLNITLPLGQKATVQAAAEGEGESVNEFVQKAILERIGLETWPECPADPIMFPTAPLKPTVFNLDKSRVESFEEE